MRPVMSRRAICTREICGRGTPLVVHEAPEAEG